MIQVEIDRIVPTDSDLRFGLVVRFGDDGPVRFAQARLPDESLDWATMNLLGAWVTRQINGHLDRERDLEATSDEPLF